MLTWGTLSLRKVFLGRFTISHLQNLAIGMCVWLWVGIRVGVGVAVFRFRLRWFVFFLDFMFFSVCWAKYTVNFYNVAKKKTNRLFFDFSTASPCWFQFWIVPVILLPCFLVDVQRSWNVFSGIKTNLFDILGLNIILINYKIHTKNSIYFRFSLNKLQASLMFLCGTFADRLTTIYENGLSYKDLFLLYCVE